MLFNIGCNEIDSIKKMDISEIELLWMVGSDENSEIESIYRSKSNKDIFKFESALSDIKKAHSTKFWSVLKELSLGKIFIKSKSGKVEYIDVTSAGFFVGGKRRADSLFYSVSLSDFIQKILLVTDREEGKLHIPIGLFEVLSGKDAYEGNN